MIVHGIGTQEPAQWGSVDCEEDWPQNRPSFCALPKSLLTTANSFLESSLLSLMTVAVSGFGFYNHGVNLQFHLDVKFSMDC